MSGFPGLLLVACAVAASIWLHGMPPGRARAVRRGSGQAPDPGAVPGAAGTSPRSLPGSGWLETVRARLRPGPPIPVGELLAALVAELSAGRPTGAALESAAAGLVPDPCPRARRAVRVGQGVPEALRADAHARGAGELRALAACWEVAEGSGAGLARAVGRLAEGVRASEEARAQLAAEVAAVRGSARLLAALPAFGLAVGHAMGADPWGWLTGSWFGWAVLGAGLLLAAAGQLWLHRIVGSVREGL